jgi:hypothetical protein
LDGCYRPGAARRRGGRSWRICAPHRISILVAPATAAA